MAGGGFAWRSRWFLLEGRRRRICHSFFFLSLGNGIGRKKIKRKENVPPVSFVALLACYRVGPFRLGSTESCLVLLGFTGFYRVLQVFIGFYWVLPSFTGFYWVLLGFTKFYWVLLGFTGFYWVLLGFIGFYSVSPSFTRFYWVLPSFYRVHSDCNPH